MGSYYVDLAGLKLTILAQPPSAVIRGVYCHFVLFQQNMFEVLNQTETILMLILNKIFPLLSKPNNRRDDLVHT